MLNQDTIGAGKFKTHCLALMREVYKTKKPITITIRGEPFIDVIPHKVEKKEEPLFGYMKGVLKTRGNVYSTGEKWSGDEDNI